MGEMDVWVVVVVISLGGKADKLEGNLMEVFVLKERTL